MNKQDIINQLVAELMYEDEYLEYYEALTKAEAIYNNMFGMEEEDGI